MLVVENDLIVWINSKLEESGWSQRELARRAGLASVTISNALAGKQSVGIEFCVGIARAFGEPPEKILRLAKLLPPLPEATTGETDLLHAWRRLSPDEQKSVLTMIRALAQSRR